VLGGTDVVGCSGRFEGVPGSGVLGVSPKAGLAKSAVGALGADILVEDEVGT
jgi:hypothetical protein